MSAWIRLSTAHRFLDRFKKVLAPQEPWDALLSALRSGLLSARCDDVEPMAGRPGVLLHSTRSLDAQDWAEATQLNPWDNAINLRSGAVASDIKVSKFELYHWLLVRSDADPEWWFEDFKAFADDNGYTLASDSEGDVAKIVPPIPPKNKGGRLSKYKWDQILIEYLVPATAALGANLHPLVAKAATDLVRVPGRPGYKAMLAYADSPRQGEMDGRGNLSLKALQDWTLWFLEVCIDQARFMGEMFDLNRLLDRMERMIQVDRDIDPAAFQLLRQAAVRGEFQRGEAGAITGLGERSARYALSHLLTKGLLTSDTPKGPVRLAFPVDNLDQLFPRLFVEV